MYCVYNEDEKIIAFHDDLEVVETYIRHLKNSNPGLYEMHVGKIKKKKLKNLQDFDNLYLVRYADTYVQSGFTAYLELVSSQYISDEKQCKEILLRILECRDLTDKERKRINKAVKIIDRFLGDSRKHTPTLEELQEYENHYYPYLYNKGTF